jgi:hypothetical protein
MTTAKELSHARLAMAAHDSDRARVVADLYRGSADMLDDSAHLDDREAARARLYTAEKLCTVLQELRSEIGRLSPQGKAWELVSAKLAMWRRVEAYWDGVVRGGEVTCDECSAPGNPEDMHAAPGVNRGVYCEMCALAVADAREEGVG